MPHDTVKATFEISLEAKTRLSALKVKLRRNGVKTTESGLLEALLAPRYLRDLENELTAS